MIRVLLVVVMVIVRVRLVNIMVRVSTGYFRVTLQRTQTNAIGVLCTEAVESVSVGLTIKLPRVSKPLIMSVALALLF